MAKHWKQFVKKEKTSEVKEELNFKTLLSSEGKTTSEKSLEDVVGFNSSLRSLLDEQKELENKMAELTGKKDKSSTDKKYNHEIKTIDQKRKAERLEEKKKYKKSKREDRWIVEGSHQKKDKKSQVLNSFKNDFKKKKEGVIQSKKKIDDAKLQIEKLKKKTGITPVSIKNKEKNLETIIGKVKAVKKQVETLKKKPKASFFNVDPKINSSIKKRQDVVIKEFLQKKKAVKNILDAEKSKKTKAEGFKNTVKTVKKVVNTYQDINKTSKKVSKSFQDFSKRLNTVDLNNMSKKSTQGTEIINSIDTQSNKVTELFNTANKYLDKTKVIGVFQEKNKVENTINNLEKKTSNAFDFDFIQSKKSKQEESQSFSVNNQKLTVDLNTIKKVKKGIETLKDLKNKKDSFSY
ncbi:hypothetical protein [Tenacibaculum jejuense]|uniref:Uncharacterized protein n=1 Tax=Tenacibaculum jejuense TaxID=584609 RepID=A0A238U679_9FLAO|nr:hypothetical protein [Tenacibaculum jejuense]SNR14108.1 protein of unknown function [Tenacibaculum jejuense]